MASGGHGLPQVSTGPTMPDPSMPCMRAFPPFQGCSAHGASNQLQSSNFLVTLRRTPLVGGEFHDKGDNVIKEHY
jgi:hypothetical protein